MKLAGNFVELGWDDVGAPSLEELRGKREPANKHEVVAYLRAGVPFIVSPCRNQTCEPRVQDDEMKTEAISLMIHRRGDQLLVTPWALSNVGFQCLDDVFVAEPGSEGLVKALDLAARRAREVASTPRDQRFRERGTPYWKRAGARSEKEFVKGATAVTVLLSDKRSELQRLVPMKDNDGMEAKANPKTLAAGLGLAEIAREVLEMLG